MPRRLLLAGDTLEAILDDARRAHGPNVRIVSAERIISGGIKGLFGRQHFEAVVELGGPPPGRATEQAVQFPHARRAGIAALLDDADGADRLVPVRPEELEMSTGGDGFAALLDELIADTGLPTPERPLTARGPSTVPGDLVALVGVGEDPMLVARAMGDRLDLLTACAGSVRAPSGRAGSADADDEPRVEDRRAATEARARGVVAGTSTAVAVGLMTDVDDARRVLDELEPEQVWVVVDASRKHADTAAWVEALRQDLHVHAMVVVGRSSTRTPETVHLLGLPEGWDAG